jgi:hypothetical protein
MQASRARAYLSFDYEHDLPLRNDLVAQSRHPHFPIAIENCSAGRDGTSANEAQAREMIRGSDVVIVLCGTYTHLAAEVEREVRLAQEEAVRCFLLRGQKRGRVRRPKGTSWFTDRLNPWTPTAIEASAREPSWWEVGWWSPR